MDEPAPTEGVPPIVARTYRALLFRWSFGVIAVVIGVGLPWLMLAALPPDELTYAGIVAPAQLLISVVVPIITVLMVYDIVNLIAGACLLPSLVAATMVKALGVSAAFGALASAMSALAAAVGGVDPWQDAVYIAVGGVLLQVGAGLIGFGLGLLFKSPLLAGLSTIVLPLGAWFVLGALNPALQWLTPFGVAQDLLSAQPDALRQWLIMVALWGGGLNLVGIMRAARRR